MDVREIGFHVKTACPRINIGQRRRDELEVAAERDAAETPRGGERELVRSSVANSRLAKFATRANASARRQSIASCRDPAGVFARDSTVQLTLSDSRRTESARRPCVSAESTAFSGSCRAGYYIARRATRPIALFPFHFGKGNEPSRWHVVARWPLTRWKS